MPGFEVGKEIASLIKGAVPKVEFWGGPLYFLSPVSSISTIFSDI